MKDLTSIFLTYHFFFKFSGLYQVPTDLERSHIIDQVIDMHTVPFPEGMGLSENSATVRDLRDSKRLLHGVLLTQPGVAELVSSLFIVNFMKKNFFLC